MNDVYERSGRHQYTHHSAMTAIENALEKRGVKDDKYNEYCKESRTDENTSEVTIPWSKTMNS